jgi:DNA polymerase III delta subunit
MLKLIHGENYYRSFSDLQKIKSENIDKEVSIVDGDTIQDVAQIFVNNESYGLFKSSNLTIVKRFFKNPKKISLEKKIIEKLEKSNADFTNLIFWEDKNIFSETRKKAKPKAKTKKPRATSKLNTYLKNNAEVKQNDNLAPDQLFNWVHAKFVEEQINISSKVCEDLILRVGQNQAILSGEIDKLKLWVKAGAKAGAKAGVDAGIDAGAKIDISVKTDEGAIANTGSTITSAIINEVTVLYEQDYQTWDLTDAFFYKNKIKALKILKRLLINPQQDFPLIIGSVLRQLKIIYTVKKYSSDSRIVMSKLRLAPFVFTKAQRIAQSFSFLELKLMYQKFIDLDYSIKSGKIDVKLGLDLLIITLS